MFKVWDSNYIDFGEYNTIEGAYGAISAFLNKIGYKSYYYNQSFTDEGAIRVDYGSHHHFFFIQEVEGSTNG